MSADDESKANANAVPAVPNRFGTAPTGIPSCGTTGQLHMICPCPLCRLTRKQVDGALSRIRRAEAEAKRKKDFCK